MSETLTLTEVKKGSAAPEQARILGAEALDIATNTATELPELSEQAAADFAAYLDELEVEANKPKPASSATPAVAEFNSSI